MKSYKERMENAKFGKDTLELLSMVGSLHDMIEQYSAIYERIKPAVCEGDGIPDFVYDKLCEAFNPAISFIENEITERFNDFMWSSDVTEI